MESGQPTRLDANAIELLEKITELKEKNTLEQERASLCKKNGRGGEWVTNIQFN